MGRSSLIPLGAAAVVVAVFAASSCSGDSNDIVVIPQPDGGTICNLAALGCPSGQACLNGICAARCAAGAACPAGTYCEGDAGIDEVCAPVEAIACLTTAVQCPAPQGCTNFGLCTSSELPADGGRQSCIAGQVDDGCSADGICITGSSQSSACVGLPACSQDGGCPVGLAGATCNVRPDGGRLFPGKQRVCLASFCDSNADCPARVPHCVTGNGPAQTFCSPGTKDFPCLRPVDCNSNICTGADAGVYGTCG
jgi:hypothetical protein